LVNRQVVYGQQWLWWARKAGKACKLCKEPILQVPAVSVKRGRSGRVCYHVRCARRVNLLRPDELGSRAPRVCLEKVS
jgi:hypothetical protein